MAFDFSGLARAIEAFIAANWTTTTIAWDNLPTSPTAGSPWVRVSIRQAVSQRVVLTGTRERGRVLRAVVFVQFFVPVGSGPAAVRSLIDGFRAMIEERDLTTESGRRVSLGTMETGETRADGERRADGSWMLTTGSFVAEMME